MGFGCGFQCGQCEILRPDEYAMFMSGDDFREPDRSIGQIIKKTRGFDLVSGTKPGVFRSRASGFEGIGKGCFLNQPRPEPGVSKAATAKPHRFQVLLTG